MSKRSPKAKSKRRSRTLPALGFAGVSLSMASGACASLGEATANTPPTSQTHSQEIFLGEEEISDVSLATFYVFDKENTGPSQQLRLARGCGGGGCWLSRLRWWRLSYGLRRLSLRWLPCSVPWLRTRTFLF
jgi:hypothetical protein